MDDLMSQTVTTFQSRLLRAILEDPFLPSRISRSFSERIRASFERPDLQSQCRLHSLPNLRR